MSSLAETTQLPETQQAGAWSGRITSNPADLNDKVYVTIAALSPDFRFGPCRWQSRDATSLPAAGDRCLVVFDENQEPYVPLWWPFNS